MQIPIACDHGAFEEKEFLKQKLTEDGHKVDDMGCFSKESVDYPDFIHPLAKAINDGKYELGIILCGTGIGASMVANKYPNVRCGLCEDIERAKLTRQHNDANILALGGRFLSKEKAREIVKVFLNTEFEGDRHIARINKIPIPE